MWNRMASHGATVSFFCTLLVGLSTLGTVHAQSNTAVLNAPLGEPAPASTPSGPAVQVVSQFYDAFVKGDTATMENLYSPDVKWKDTIFSFPDRKGTMGMWD